ncbi:uncharacterized protein EHS24_001639 [Apiotrichum porosum]|uniref:Copper transport protein n=1 Tax=Apiotrichum porosum TaxID=105984 RepID=A0A427XIP1_9TREE|nr:uncharacterized protein EHS24_001639 [Apiotrichum porosum]RSH78740.1 hypothetical protein EHS24_001639 [Apiotrichum porosum]
MDHGDHSGHGGHDMPSNDTPMAKCSMNMLWNHQVADTCVVFRSWHVSGWAGMVFSCFAIIAISVGYAALLAHSRKYERGLAAELAAQPRPPTVASYSAVPTDESGKLGVTDVPLSARVRRAAMYAASVAISYFLMLVAMTYNTYLCSAIVIGAFLGHLVYEGQLDLNSVLNGSSARGLACH